MTNDISEALVAFFMRLAHSDETLLRKLAEADGIRIDDEGIHFRLQDLHDYLSRNEDAITGLGYPEFRKQLYQSPVNKRLGAIGTEVAIAENMSNVDLSVYVLRWAKPL